MRSSASHAKARTPSPNGCVPYTPPSMAAWKPLPMRRASPSSNPARSTPTTRLTSSSRRSSRWCARCARYTTRSTRRIPPRPISSTSTSPASNSRHGSFLPRPASPRHSGHSASRRRSPGNASRASSLFLREEGNPSVRFQYGQANIVEGFKLALARHRSKFVGTHLFTPERSLIDFAIVDDDDRLAVDESPELRPPRARVTHRNRQHGDRADGKDAPDERGVVHRDPLLDDVTHRHEQQQVKGAELPKRRPARCAGDEPEDEEGNRCPNNDFH